MEEVILLPFVSDRFFEVDDRLAAPQAYLTTEAETGRRKLRRKRQHSFACGQAVAATAPSRTRRFPVLRQPLPGLCRQEHSNQLASWREDCVFRTGGLRRMLSQNGRSSDGVLTGVSRRWVRRVTCKKVSLSPAIIYRGAECSLAWHRKKSLPLRFFS